MSRLTCLTCQVAFTDADLHRNHFKNDWHRYNLKRKVADLPCVTAEAFEARKEAHEAQAKVASGEVKEPGNYCVACGKNFKKKKAYESHINSKKHQEMILKFEANTTNEAGPPSTSKSTSNKNQVKVVEDDDDEDDEGMEVEEVDSDEWDEDDEDAIPVTDCVFCSHHSHDMDTNIKHMMELHGFFIPDPEYLTDTVGLLEYLGAKVGQGLLCLWCSEKGKRFNSLDAVQKHMVDKGHCKLLHEGDALVEYDEFYDYSSSYPEGQDDPEAEVAVDSLDNDGFQLVLPSGATVGHRSLMRYFKQSLNPNRELVLANSGRNSLVSTYRAMGWTGTTGEMAKSKARDQKFIRKTQAKHWMKVGCKANLLQHHYREQNPM